MLQKFSFPLFADKRIIKELNFLRENAGSVTKQTLIHGATTTMELSKGKWADLELTGNVTSFVFSGLKANDAGLIFVKQAGTGSYTINFGSAKLPVGGLALSTAVGSVTIIGYVFDGTNVFLSKENYGVV